MTQQFLHDLQFRSSRSKQRRICVTKSMPADSFDNAKFLGNRKNVTPHDLLCQIRPAPIILRTREHPAFGRLVRSLAVPLAKGCDEIIVSRDRFLGALCLAYARRRAPRLSASREAACYLSPHLSTLGQTV